MAEIVVFVGLGLFACAVLVLVAGWISIRQPYYLDYLKRKGDL